MTATAAPTTARAMVEWVSMGGANLGIVGDGRHSSGFHRSSREVPRSDYSRRRDPAGPDSPANWDWACAGDFGHRGDPALRGKHLELLNRLMQGDPALSMICELIGQLWEDQRVKYWARWQGLSNYTGAGHDTWTHVSWYRSRADRDAPLWTPGTVPEPLRPAPAFPGYNMRYSRKRLDGNVWQWQSQMRFRGWRISADGYFGSQTLKVVRKFQNEKGLGTDGVIGPVTWRAAWELPLT